MPEEKKLPEKPKLYKRFFMNPDEGTAFVEVSFEHDDEYYGRNHEGKKTRGINGHIKLADCNRQVCLEFWCNDEAERASRIIKLRALEDAIRDARVYMETHQIDVEPEELAAARAKKKKK